MHLNTDFIQQMENKLKEAKEQIETDLAGLPEHTELGQRQDENALEAEEDAVNMGIRVRLQADLEKINKALQKISDGTYGKDDQGKKISKERLEALPWADKAI